MLTFINKVSKNIPPPPAIPDFTRGAKPMPQHKVPQC